MNQLHRWRFGAVAGAVALIASVVTLPVYALSLGRISVLSALGEPLRAEIDVAQITPEEASSLKAAVGTPEAFKAAGLEYTPVLAGLEVTLQRRADGRAYLRLTSSRPVSEPFVDLVLQATWAAGRLTRDYTMLFDPPGSRSGATAVAPTAPILSRPATPGPARAPAPSVASESSPATPPATREARPAQPALAARPEPRVRPSAPRIAAAENSGAADKQLTVKSGDTAGRIAAQNRPETVSLDQMLVAMLRGNPDAFIGGNINRLKSGAVLDMPGADTAGSIPASEASQTIIAQSKDFNNFRRKLAEGVATTTINPADRQAGGQVQAKVEDRAPATAAPDKLTLSKGSVQAKSAAAAAEDAIARNRQASEASTRVAELSKNISDLNKLGVTPGPATAAVATAPAASAAKLPGLVVPTPSVVPTPTVVATPSSPAALPTAPSDPTASAGSPATAAAASAAAAATAPSVSQPASAAASAAVATAAISAASQPTDSAAKAPVAVANKTTTLPVPAVETSFMDDLLLNPLVLPLAAGLLALLAGLGIYSYRKRKSSAPVDSSFLESRLQPDSFFGASGGQRIDTNEVSASGSSLVYSPSQLDAAGDVDPVAEADVYLAYGRDLQAEEILKEALRTTPTRVAIHAKMAEIYAKRRDHKAFEAIALEAFNVSQGNGPEWAYVTEMGRELDALNPLYQPGRLPVGDKKTAAPTTERASAAGVQSGATGVVAIAAVPGAAVAGSSAFSSAPNVSQAPKSSVDVDLDLDFPLDDIQDGRTSPAPIAALPTPEPVRAPMLDSLDMDFSDISSKPIALTHPVPISDKTDLQPNSVKADPIKTQVAAAAPAAVLPDSGMLEFDLDSLSLDLNSSHAQNSGNSVAAEEDPLLTKFLLAEEFRSLGDADGARALAEEVLAEARGPLKVKAQAFLNALV